MNNKGGISKAYLQFREDLKTDADFIEFKENSVRKIYVDKFARSTEKTIWFSAERGKVKFVTDYKLLLSRCEETVHYGVPEVNSKETRRLNKKLLK